jgi:hypothetical protein
MILDAIARRFQGPLLADLTKLAVEARLERVEKAVAVAKAIAVSAI